MPDTAHQSFHRPSLPTPSPSHGGFDLSASAVAEMAHNGFDLEAVPGAAEQLAAIVADPPVEESGAVDLRALPWSSIDNDTSRDLDQIEWAEALFPVGVTVTGATGTGATGTGATGTGATGTGATGTGATGTGVKMDGAATVTGGANTVAYTAADTAITSAAGMAIRVRIAIADVAATVAKDTPLDSFAARQSQTVYTAAHNFPMLPVELSTGLTSLNPDEDRNALVAEFTVGVDGSLSDAKILAARVRNTAQLTYHRIGPLLDAEAGSGMAAGNGRAAAGEALHGGDSNGAEALPETLVAQLRLQVEAARRIRSNRQAAGALDFRRAEAQPVVVDGVVQSLESSLHNTAMDLIEDLMIAANETAARTLREAKRSALRRVVRSPERWARIVEVMKPLGYALAATPDSGALNAALTAQREKDPDHYPDLALAVIKLMGAGEYVLVKGDDPEPPSHFALAAMDYAHSTAPNRRYADLVTQRLLHALLNGVAAPYTDDELTAIAAHCNERDAAARKVERAMTKRAQALALASHIGQQYDAIVTGAGPKGTFLRVLQPPVEGMLLHPEKVPAGGKAPDVGDRLRVVLAHTDAAKAFIDFVRA